MYLMSMPSYMSFRHHSLSDNYLNNRCTNLDPILYMGCYSDFSRVMLLELKIKQEVHFPIIISTNVSHTSIQIKFDI